MQDVGHQRTHSKYLDFELEVGIGGGRTYPVAVLDSPAGEARATMYFPLDDLALENRFLALQNALLRSGGQPRRTLLPEQQAVRNFGRELFEMLFAPEVRSCYDVSLREAAQQRKGLRLKLRIQPPELAALPWEYLWHPGQAEYVSLSTRTPIVRYLEVPQRIQPLAVTPPLRILGMIASPSDLPSLNPDRERHRIERALRDLTERGLVELTWLKGQSWRDLLRMMRQGTWHIFHFIGHGGFDHNSGEGLIVLADRKGNAAQFSATRLGRLLADHDALRLVLLNSCEGARGDERDIFSSTASILVRRGIPAVLAMQYEITDQAAIEFARTFYEAVGDGMPVDGAVAEARKAMSFAVNNTVEWGTPVLYMRSPDGVLFEVAETEFMRRSAPSVSEALPDVDEESAARLEQLYLDGLGAFWLKQWDKAVRSLQAVVSKSPDYRDGDAAAKLEEAKHRRKLEALYAQAQTTREAKDWRGMLSALEKLVAEQPEFQDAADLLEMAKRQKRLADLYTQAQQLQKAKQWRAVVNVFAQIGALDPEYPDPENLLLTAEREAAEQERKAELTDLYNRALLEMDAGRWWEARHLLAQLQETDPGYGGVEQLLNRAEAEITPEEEERQRQARVELLHEEAGELSGSQEWQQALDRIQEIRDIDPDFADPNGIAARAQEGLARQQRLEDLYARAQTAQEAGDWRGVIVLLERLTSEVGGFRDATSMLEEAKRQRRLAKSYDEAQRLHQSGEWQAVVGLFNQITALEPGYADPEGLFATARAKIEAQERQMKVEDLYDRAVTTMDDGRWPEAQRFLLQVRERKPGYRDTETLLAGAQVEPERATAERHRQERIASLYEEARALIREHRWPEAMSAMEAIYAVDTAFADPDKIAAKAGLEIEREREEKQRQEDLTIPYDEAVGLHEVKEYQPPFDKWGEIQAVDPSHPDSKKVQVRAAKRPALDRPAAWRRLPRWAIAIIAGGVLVAVVVAAIQRGGGSAPSVTHPTATATATEAIVPTATATLVPLPTSTATLVPLPTSTATGAPRPAATATLAPHPRATVKSVPWPTATPTETTRPTAMPTETTRPTATPTETPWPTATSVRLPPLTATGAPRPTVTATLIQ